jgi:hypothetical protein
VILDPFDVFKIEQNGSVSWLRAIDDFQHAKSYVDEVRDAETPADFLILNQRLPTIAPQACRLRSVPQPELSPLPSATPVT